MTVDMWENKGNKHLDLSNKDAVLPYHELIARLACKYLPKKGRMLDIGCGLGQIDAKIAETRPDVNIFIADAYESCINNVKAKVRVKKSFLLNENNIDLSLVGTEYDTVVMSHVLEHLLNPAETVLAVLSIIRPNGCLILAVPNPVRPHVIISNLFKKHYVNRGHVYSWDRSHWINFIENILGLNVLEYASDSVNIFPKVLKNISPMFLMKVEVALAKLIPWFSFSHVVVIRKNESL